MLKMPPNVVELPVAPPPCGDSAFATVPNAVYTPPVMPLSAFPNAENKPPDF